MLLYFCLNYRLKVMNILNYNHILKSGRALDKKPCAQARGLADKKPCAQVRGLVMAALLWSVLFCFVGEAGAQSAFDDPGSRSSKSKGSGLVAVDGKINAGAVALGSASQVVILLRNDGGQPITSGTISLYPSSNVSAKISENECHQQTLPPDAVCAIALSVKGLQPGKFRVEMLMRHDGRTKLITTTVSGSVEQSDDSSRDIISDLETIPSDLKFGTLKESRPLTRSIVLRNVTSTKINVDSINIESNDQSGYTLKSNCDSLESGQACIVTVTWAPQQRGPATGVLVVNHDGPTGVVSVILDGKYDPGKASQVGVFPEAVPGKGLLTASQTAIDFGSNIESASAITVSLVNVGDMPLTLEEIRLSGDDNGIEISSTGCRKGVVLDPVEACPLTLTWEPVRVGSILDDVQILHDGARGILVLPLKGKASKAVNKDSQSIVFGGEAGAILRAIPPLSESEVTSIRKSERKFSSGNSRGNTRGSLEGYKITSLAKRRAIVSGPGGSRVVFDGEETVIGGVLWRVGVRQSSVNFTNGNQTIVLLFDRSLSSFDSGSGNSTASTNSSEENN